MEHPGRNDRAGVRHLPVKIEFKRTCARLDDRLAPCSASRRADDIEPVHKLPCQPLAHIAAAND